MAPYTMTIDIHNNTDVAMEWIGYSNYSGLDGHTEVQFDQRIEAGKTGRVKISKSGGTDGLFTMASYYFPYRTGTVSIYAMMPASAGSDATAKLVDHSFYRKYSFVDSSKKGAATEWWDKRNYEEVTDGPFSENTIETEQAGEYKLPPGYGFQDVWRLTVSGCIAETKWSLCVAL